MDIKIRRITVDEAIVLSELSIKTFFDTFVGTCTDEDMASFLQKYFSISEIEKELRIKGAFYYFAEIDGVPVGYIKYMEDYSFFEEVKKWKALELKRIYVLKEYQGKGVAQALMNNILQYAAENEYEVVWLGVWEHNVKAQKFYEKYGFTNTGHPHDFPIGNTPQTDYWFWKFL